MWNYKKQQNYHVFHVLNVESTHGINGLAITHSHRGKNARYVKKNKLQEHDHVGGSGVGSSQISVILKRLDEISTRMHKLEEHVNPEKGPRPSIKGDISRTSYEKKGEFGN